MKNSISKIQTDHTYNVEYNGSEYAVTCEENLMEGYMEWSVFDEQGELLEEFDPELGDEIIEFVIKNC